MSSDLVTSYTYATLLETNEAEMEAWNYFIRYQGNEEALRQLQSQLEQVDFYILEGLSTFDLEMDFLVCEKTAKEMTKLDLNSHSFHRKFDGVLKPIDFEFRKKDSNETKICKVFDTLGYGQIEDYIDNEDIDPEDLVEMDEDNNQSMEEEENNETPMPRAFKLPNELVRKMKKHKIN